MLTHTGSLLSRIILIPTLFGQLTVYPFIPPFIILSVLYSRAQKQSLLTWALGAACTILKAIWLKLFPIAKFSQLSSLKEFRTSSSTTTLLILFKLVPQVLEIQLRLMFTHNYQFAILWIQPLATFAKQILCSYRPRSLMAKILSSINGFALPWAAELYVASFKRPKTLQILACPQFHWLREEVITSRWKCLKIQFFKGNARQKLK